MLRVATEPQCVLIHLVSCTLFKSPPPPLRDEQYHSLWSELETMAQLCASFSDLHGQLAQLIAQAAASSPCVQQAAPRKTPKAGEHLLLPWCCHGVAMASSVAVCTVCVCVCVVLYRAVFIGRNLQRMGHR